MCCTHFIHQSEAKKEKLIQEQTNRMEQLERRIEQLERRIEQLERQLQEKENESQEYSLPKGIRGSAAIEGNMAYFRIDDDPYVHEYDSSNDKWQCI